DLQWASESLEPFKQLQLFQKDYPWFLIGSYRADETPDLPERLAGSQVIKLERLSEQGIAALSVSMLGSVGQQPHIVELLRRETEGNALFMVEVVRVLAENAGGLRDIAALTLPKHVFAGGIQQILRRRLSRVPDSMAKLLKFSAVLGRELDPEVVAQAGAGDNNLIENFLTTCAGAAVLEIVDNHWRFAHDKLRETILQDLSPEERPVLHREVAEALESVYPDDNAYADALVEHWYNAGDVRKTLGYTLIISEQKINFTSEYMAARHFLNRGLRLLEQLPEDQQNNYRAKLLLWSGNLYERQGNYPDAGVDYRVCLKLVETVDLTLTIRTLQGLASLESFEGNHTAARDYAQQAMRLSEQMGNETFLSYSANQLGLMAYYMGDYAASKSYHEQSLEIDRRKGDQLGVARNLNGLGLIVAQMRDYDTARDYYEQTLAISREIGDRLGVAYALGNLGSLVYESQNYEMALIYTRQSLAIKQEIGDPLGTGIGFNNMGDIALQLGDIDTARTCLLKGLEQILEIQMVPLMLELLINFARLRLSEGDITTAGHWLGLATYHPAVFAETLNGVGRLLRTKLQALIPEDQLLVLMEQGKKLDLDTVVQQILAEYGAPQV
ncbi:MAG TPA: tetratricopeptide repeat protein, partial [Phototrophicaceae bacterium]|nr:tetratricopeptide repeat protein [Phototrophicaceae bacterium]